MARKILLVDDDRVNRLLTQTILEELGYEVEVLADGRGAADAVATGGFEAIAMDCQMPHVDGFEATAEIRRRQAKEHGIRTPIIGLSARAMRGDEEVALTRGMDAYVTKPVSVRKLQVALEQVLGKQD
ncbi:MAG: response regulator [Actinomycetota bacterium]|nr:response regulator [Actinomycetota bacterium]